MSETWRRAQSGQTLVVLALSVFVLMGMGILVIEVGRLAAFKGWLTNVCDNAAIGGASALPNQTIATPRAQLIGTSNGSDSTTVSYPNSDQIEVICQDRFFYLMAGMWGFAGSDVRTRAVAQRLGVVTEIFRGARPIGIASTSYTQGVSKTLTMLPVPLPSTALPIDHFVALDWGDATPATYVRNIEDGYSGSVRVNDTFSPALALLTDNLRAIVTDPLTGRALFTQASQPPYSDNGSNYAYPDYPLGDPRIVIVPLIDKVADPLSFRAVVRGFGAFYISDVNLLGLQITGRFLDLSLPAARAASGGAGTDYGVRVYRLVE